MIFIGCLPEVVWDTF